MRELKYTAEQLSGGFINSSERPYCSLPNQTITDESLLLALRAGLDIDKRDTHLPLPVGNLTGSIAQGITSTAVDRLATSYSRPQRTLGSRPVQLPTYVGHLRSIHRI